MSAQFATRAGAPYLGKLEVAASRALQLAVAKGMSEPEVSAAGASGEWLDPFLSLRNALLDACDSRKCCALCRYRALVATQAVGTECARPRHIQTPPLDMTAADCGLVPGPRR